MSPIPNACVFLLLCLSLAVRGQTGSPIFPAERHGELRQEVVYQPPEVPETVAQSEPTGPLLDFGAFRWPLIVGVSVLLLIGLAVLLHRIQKDLGSTRSGKSSSETAAGPVSVSEVREEELVSRGISPQLLQRAEAAAQYDLAVRLLYLDLLNRLQLAQLIGYRPHFSNRDYRAQLDGHPLSEEFAQAVRTYERYWYGKHRIDRLSYRVAHGVFTNLQARIP
ncbi:hypothetical protein GGR28_001653 [Lewinella aquimaris]|uniref:Protein-glutamine gamma-glutamyltransferase-like C-terminal domain-containing protein n=1 Tax=Neolewinella aquimaris TaxID=1835722 RepID=A0A840EDM6_9BACT|nr:DUF4129 domain-containing protein [Neolewinella aquimaris]MBB4079036.1 hypothetical protein [Neolewinella aquimaris]